MVTTTMDISKRIDPAMKQVPKPMKKPTTPAEAAAAKKSVASKVEAGDDKLMKYKCGGKVAMKKGGEVKPLGSPSKAATARGKVKCMKKGGKVKSC